MMPTIYQAVYIYEHIEFLWQYYEAGIVITFILQMKKVKQRG